MELVSLELVGTIPNTLVPTAVVRDMSLKKASIIGFAKFAAKSLTTSLKTEFVKTAKKKSKSIKAH